MTRVSTKAVKHTREPDPCRIHMVHHLYFVLILGRACGKTHTHAHTDTCVCIYARCGRTRLLESGKDVTSKPRGEFEKDRNECALGGAVTVGVHLCRRQERAVKVHIHDVFYDETHWTYIRTHTRRELTGKCIRA